MLQNKKNMKLDISRAFRIIKKYLESMKLCRNKKSANFGPIFGTYQKKDPESMVLVSLKKITAMWMLIYSCIELQGALERVVKHGDFTTA